VVSVAKEELKHINGEAERFDRDLQQLGICVRVGLKVTGPSRRFERLPAELGFEVWIGDPAEDLNWKSENSKVSRRR